MAKKLKNEKSKRANKSHTPELASSKDSKLRFFRLVHHKHTGKLLHYRHTSHLALAYILAFVGVVIYMNQEITMALPQSKSRELIVTAVVKNDPPTVGAAITSPTNGATLAYKPKFQVRGTCAPNTLVVITSNNSVVGSVSCTSAGIFVLEVQLTMGINILRARNYDGLNRPGPETPAVKVTVIGGSISDKATYPLLPSILTSCEGYSAPVVSAESAARVAVVCLPRSVDPNKIYTIGVLVWGGSSPYALDIDWGDGTENTLLSLVTSGYRGVEFQYATPGIYKVSLKLRDKDGRAAFVQTSILVNGKTPTLFSGIKDGLDQLSWFELPIPLYFLAVALTLGFWLGDLFERRLVIAKPHKKTRRRTR